MTSLLLPVSARQRAFDLGQFSAHLPSNVSFEMQPDDDHSLHLPVAVLAEGSEAHTDNIAIVGHLGDEICVSVRRSFVEHDDRGFRIRKLADYGHQFFLDEAREAAQ